MAFGESSCQPPSLGMDRKRKVAFAVILFGFTAIAFYFCLPATLFDSPYCTVIDDANGRLLNATVASDGQWRFPAGSKVPQKFRDAITLFEDKRFETHWGVDVLALGRATRQNIKAGEVISGGSTLTMQVIRLSRKNRSRTIAEKLIEMVLAARLEFRLSKPEILELYAAHAPFGGNVVGLEAACWRFFGRSSADITWADAALLAVLPNNPSLIHVGKNRARLKAKRDRLLQRLYESNKIDELTLTLSKSEPIPEAPRSLPRLAKHLQLRATRDGKEGQRVASTLKEEIQARVVQLLEDHHRQLKSRQIFNAGALIVEVETGRVLAYVGNVDAGVGHQQDVDVTAASRSTGSILKPFLFAAMLDEGKMLPHSLFPDVPTVINGFAPKNFSKEFDGAVPASAALIRSLNVPAVHQLREYRYEKFHELLKNMGLTTLVHQPDHYGLSLVLGGAEGTLWDITGAYASMARVLNHYFERPGSNRYFSSDIHPLVYDASKDTTNQLERADPQPTSWLSAGAIYQTFEVLKEVYRPGEETGWQFFNNAKRIAWKTGTSHGFRDAWAVGVNPQYAVGVWVGNADGEGRPGLTGTAVAAPILFDLFSLLPGSSWFSEPASELNSIEVCRQSGHRANEWCVDRELHKVTKGGLSSQPCPYHKPIHVSPDLRYRVHANCQPLEKMTRKSWFVLPPVQEFYFRSKNLSYHPLPPFRKDCENPNVIASLDLIYPQPHAKLFLPRVLDGTKGFGIFEAVHRNAAVRVHWHLDQIYLGSTVKSHKMPVQASVGRHVLTLVDENGEIVNRSFSVLF